MIVSAGFAAPCVGQTLPSDRYRLRTAQLRWVRVDHAVGWRGAHASASDEMRITLDRQYVLRTSGMEDILDDACRVSDVRLVVLAEAVVEVGNR